ncbi:MAG: hypothetical protein COS08_06750 [Euryarchaeota archaeon CG01_land_8_20_14_3_00_38_12]|nr:MAG: hypothetical protein COS08_06750 [Euryarchaeota archaeon CG01_land_8_20_14_3_00_38_12]PJB20948.1 MAG: hypothetical protein CO114_07950 [Euryarchaeota archaeon CG_4_9_14_3_um_filter_38_12]
MAVKLLTLELFDYVKQEFRPIEAIVDTGASRCTLAKHLAVDFGIKIEGSVVHHWQANGPLIGNEINIKIRYKGVEYELKANCIGIEEKFLRDVKPGEECTRPKGYHPLKYRFIVGLNFIDLLSEQDKLELISYISR